MSGILDTWWGREGGTACKGSSRGNGDEWKQSRNIRDLQPPYFVGLEGWNPILLVVVVVVLRQESKKKLTAKGFKISIRVQ